MLVVFFENVLVQIKASWVCSFCISKAHSNHKTHSEVRIITVQSSLTEPCSIRMLLRVLRETNVSLPQTLDPITLLQKTCGRSPCIVLWMTRGYKSSPHFSYKRNCEQSNWRVINVNICNHSPSWNFASKPTRLGAVWENRRLMVSAFLAG